MSDHADQQRAASRRTAGSQSPVPVREPDPVNLVGLMSRAISDWPTLLRTCVLLVVVRLSAAEGLEVVNAIGVWISTLPVHSFGAGGGLVTLAVIAAAVRRRRAKRTGAGGGLPGRR
jgi:hypothetical protein